MDRHRLHVGRVSEGDDGEVARDREIRVEVDEAASGSCCLLRSARRRSGDRQKQKAGLELWGDGCTFACGRQRCFMVAVKNPARDFSAILEPAGFRAVSITDLPPYHYGIMFDRGADVSIFSGKAAR